MVIDKNFSWQRLEQVAKKCADTIKETDGNISTDEFLDVIVEIRKIFDVLGTIVSLAFQDINKKIGEIQDAKSAIDAKNTTGGKGKCEGGDNLWKILDAELRKTCLETNCHHADLSPKRFLINSKLHCQKHFGYFF